MYCVAASLPLPRPGHSPLHCRRYLYCQQLVEAGDRDPARPRRYERAQRKLMSALERQVGVGVGWACVVCNGRPSLSQSLSLSLSLSLRVQRHTSS